MFYEALANITFAAAIARASLTSFWQISRMTLDCRVGLGTSGHDTDLRSKLIQVKFVQQERSAPKC
jgi:hypothetical protein